MDDLQLATIVVGGIIAFCAGIGIFTKLNLDRKNKIHKKLSKKQKREQHERL